MAVLAEDIDEAVVVMTVTVVMTVVVVTVVVAIAVAVVVAVTVVMVVRQSSTGPEETDGAEHDSHNGGFLKLTHQVSTSPGLRNPEPARFVQLWRLSTFYNLLILS
ncbi:hypothetical protein [Streptomyces sp. KR80]|uniref:hypothetical protein n=1 Tax=Streptomyces sp. KR80 TaxID=3457426 RepID=UPI003FD3F88F